MHNSAVAMTKLRELGYELLLRPPYSPDLAPATSMKPRSQKLPKNLA